MNAAAPRFVRATVLALVLLSGVAAACAPALAAPAATAAESPLAQAQKLYDGARFTEAITLLRQGLSGGQIIGNDVVAARALLGRALVKAGNRLEARQAFETALRADPAYRLDPVVVPPDEMDVFNLALKAVTAEQIEAGKRVPASIAFFFGAGSGDNKSLGDIQHFLGGSDKLDSKSEFGASVRFPLRPRLSLDLELARLRATGHDTTAAPNQIKFEAAATPMVVSLYWAAQSGARERVNLFVGAGPLTSATNSIDLPFFSPGLRIKLADEKTGTYFHVGGEGEWLVHPRVALSGRVLYRSATASKLYDTSTLELYGTKPLKGRKVDFSGFGAYIGLRAYIGY